MKYLAVKLIQIMKECNYIMKNGENDFHGYKYATSADVLSKVNAALVQQGICSIAVPELLSMADVKTAKGNIEKLATVKMAILLIDKDSGETATITGLGSGQDSSDKAVMKAQTAAIKYAYMMSFAIATGDDPELEETVEEKHRLNQKLQQRKIITEESIASKYKCTQCGSELTEKVYTYSVNRFGNSLCLKCQKNYQNKIA